MKADEKVTKSSVRDPRLEVYQAPKVVTMTSAQLLEQIGPAQG